MSIEKLKNKRSFKSQNKRWGFIRTKRYRTNK